MACDKHSYLYILCSLLFIVHIQMRKPFLRNRSKNTPDQTHILYIQEYAPVKGDYTIKWLAQLYCYSNVLTGSPAISLTKEYVTDTANTLEQAQIEKISNAAEKGDKIFFIENCGGPGLWDMWIVYCILYTILNLKMKLRPRAL